MTNFEKIKSMTIEEMAEDIDESGLWCDRCAFIEYSEDCESKSCKEGYVKWLNQETEE